MRSTWFQRVEVLGLVLALLAGLLVVSPPGSASAALSDTPEFADYTDKINTKNTQTPPTLQFLSEGHILGFAPNKSYLAGLDHALAVEFIGGQGTRPAG